MSLGSTLSKTVMAFVSNTVMAIATTVVLISAQVFAADARFPQTLPKTKSLTETKPLDELMISGINKFAERELQKSVERRSKFWKRDYSSHKAYETSIAGNRDRLKKSLGVVDSREKSPRFEILSTISDKPENEKPGQLILRYVRWRVMRGVTAEGLLVNPNGPVKARVIVLPDAEWTPEEIANVAGQRKIDVWPLVTGLASRGCQVVIPTLISRADTYSGHPDVVFTNQPHREFIYRMGFEMGRHIIGYEVQKILAAVDAFSGLNERAKKKIPIGVMGIGEGGMLAFYSAAVDPRIDATLVSGYFQQRENIWQEPIYRNVWGLLTEFGDAEIASLIAPRHLVIESCVVPEVDGPPKVKSGRRGGAAPGKIRIPDPKSVQIEIERAKIHFDKLKVGNRILHVDSQGAAISKAGLGYAYLLENLGIKFAGRTGSIRLQLARHDATDPLFDPAKRQRRQFQELVRFTQNLLRKSAHKRDRFWADAKRGSVAEWIKTSAKYRKYVWEELIGRLPDPTMPPNVRTRKILDQPKYVGYEVMIDVYPDVIAAGILLLPKDLKTGEKRPVVVCQHGLEGVPMDTITSTGNGYRYYKSFAAKLAERGFITYAPQNPYRGHDKFRVIQRKSNPLKRSLFSYIIPQHQRTLQWLATLPNVDAKRIAFYGLSYGGKTAVRVPPILVPPKYRDKNSNDAPESPGYCLSICSADYNEWVRKNVSNLDRYSYLFTVEYEMFEWNMGHVANYAELSNLMTPRPFMVERGHHDGVAPDEWVAWEYAKVRRHYAQLGLADKTKIEFFNGPHTINGQGTFRFLHKHLNWPERK